MKINVCFSWCDYFFQWTIDRKLPVLPSKGDCLSIIQPGDDSFVDEKDNERYKNIRMKGVVNMKDILLSCGSCSLTLIKLR